MEKFTFRQFFHLLLQGGIIKMTNQLKIYFKLQKSSLRLTQSQ